MPHVDAEDHRSEFEGGYTVFLFTEVHTLLRPVFIYPSCLAYLYVRGQALPPGRLHNQSLATVFQELPNPF